MAPVFDMGFRAALLELLQWRRDVRRFRRDRLPEGTIEALLGLADLSPSVGLSQPWRFVIVDDPARRAAIGENFRVCNARALAESPEGRAAIYARLKLAGIDRAPCHVALFADPDPAQGHGLGRRTMPDMPIYSAVIAAHTLWLAARADGIGLGWVSILDPAEVARCLDVPRPWVFLGYLCLGYPEAECDTPALEREGWEHRRPVEARILRR